MRRRPSAVASMIVLDEDADLRRSPRFSIRVLFVVRDGKIHAAWEYLDTQHAADLLLG